MSLTTSLTFIFKLCFWNVKHLCLQIHLRYRASPPDIFLEFHRFHVRVYRFLANHASRTGCSFCFLFLWTLNVHNAGRNVKYELRTVGQDRA